MTWCVIWKHLISSKELKKSLILIFNWLYFWVEIICFLDKIFPNKIGTNIAIILITITIIAKENWNEKTATKQIINCERSALIVNKLSK